MSSEILLLLLPQRLSLVALRTSFRRTTYPSRTASFRSFEAGSSVTSAFVRSCEPPAINVDVDLPIYIEINIEVNLILWIFFSEFL